MYHNIHYIPPIVVDASTAVGLPSMWVTMADSENLKVITLQTTDADYLTVSANFTRSLGTAITILKVQ
jgi:hypothetical protein